MNSFFISAGVVLLLLMFLVLIRVVKGPSVVDRLVGVNIIGTKAIVMIILMGLIFDRLDMFIDIALGYGLLNFIASVAAAKYFQNTAIDIKHKGTK
jgi:multicomponent Na+:H+ antiporter subunit F